MTIRVIAAIVFTVLAVIAAAKAQDFLPENRAEQSFTGSTPSDERLLIVNGSTGHVIFDDGQDDLLCITRKVIVGYDDWGFPIRKNTMHCR